MRLALTRPLAVSALLALTACGGSPADDVPASASADPTTTSDTSTTVLETRATTTASTTTATISTATSSTTATATTTTTLVSAPSFSTSPPEPCSPTPELTTPSGRRVTLRAEGLTGPSPTILVIHGYTGTPSGIERVANLTEFALANGIAVAYPHGTPTDVEGFAWDTGARVFAITGVDDVAALDEMLTAIEETGCVDTGRVVITGESNGGGMTLAALCDPRLSGRFRSAVMVIPAIDDGVLERCGGDIDAVTPLIAVAGRIDRTAPFEGGNGLLPQLDWFERVAASRGCSGVSVAAPITQFADRYEASGCGACTELIAVADGPHTWPGTPEGNGGLAAGKFDLNRRIVDDLVAPEPGCLSTR